MIRPFTFAAFALAASAAIAHSEVTNPAVKARMEAMKSIAANMKALTQMARGEVAFDAAAVEARMTEIAATAGEVPILFEAPETDPASEAKATIWTSFPDFSARAADLQSAASAGTSAADEFDLEESLGTLAQTCKSCHSSFKM